MCLESVNRCCRICEPLLCAGVEDRHFYPEDREFIRCSEAGEMLQVVGMGLQKLLLDRRFHFVPSGRDG